MTEPNLCGKCGRPLLHSDALSGRCPLCLLQQGFESGAGEAIDPEPANGPPDPSAIGRYRILRRIGEGGMGVVYEAEQDHPRRTVALKIIKPGMASPELLRRFEQESQALGRLQHPGIAQIYEAGTVDTGFGPQPYFAMELIRGSSPRQYAEAQQLGTRERLEIMAKICDAVHHAHQRGLIHRDLKPGNILIDESGQPKILDFGVARVTDSDARATLQTDVGQLIGTLAYMSPEQVLADPLDIDTRSDVYSLGVILYEFLSGRLPYPISKKIHETIQSIREEDPARLSGVNRAFRGDIETIVARALEKDRSRRYASAAEMAADIRRYLKDEPIVARPPSTAYQLGKFAQRNRALVTGVAAVIITLTLGVAAATWWATQAGHERDNALQAKKEASEQSDRANDSEKKAEAARQQAVVAQQQAQMDRDDAIAQKERADREAAIAKAVREFLGNDLLQMANPVRQTADSSRNPDITVKEALDRAASRIGRRFEGQPLVEAEIREVIAETYFGIGDNANGREHWERVLELRRRTQGEDHPQTLHVATRLVAVNYKLNRLRDAETLIANVLQSARRIAKTDNATMQLAFSDLVEAFSSTVPSRSATGIATVETGLMVIIDDVRYNSGSIHTSTNWAVAELVLLHQLNPRIPPERAKTYLEQLYQDQRRRLGDENATTMNTLRQLYLLYMASQEPDYLRAEAFLKPLVADQRRNLGDSNRATQAGTEMLIGIYTGQPQPKLTPATELLEAALASARRTLNDSNPTVRQMMYQLANLYFQQKKYAEAETLLVPMVRDSAVQAIIRGDHRSPNEVLSLLESMDMLAQIYAIRGKTGPADSLAKSLNDVLAVLAATDLTSETATAFPGMGLLTMGNFGLRYLSQGRDSEGNALIRKTLEGYRTMAQKDPSSQSVSYPLLISATEILKDNGSKEEKFLRDLLEIQRAELGNDNPATTFTTRILSHQYLMHYKFPESEALAEDLVVSYARVLGPSNIGTLQAMNRLSLSYAAAYSYALMQGQPEQAHAVLEEGAAHAARFLAAKLNSPDGKIYGEMQFPFLSLGNAYAALGRYREAEAVFKQFLAFQEEMDVASGMRLPTVASIGWVQYRQQKYSDAETNLRRAANGVRNVDTWERYNTESMLGAVLVAQEKYSEGEPLLVGAFEQMLLRSPRTSPFFGSTLVTAEAEPGERILELYQKWGKPEKVREWQQKVKGAPNFRTPPPPEFSLSYVPPLERMLR